MGLVTKSLMRERANEMRKFHLFGLVFAAVLAFFAIATSAFATELQWLVGGAAILEALEAETEGELELVTLNAAGGELEVILCEGIFDGLIELKGADTVDLVLNVAQQEILLGVRALECKVELDEGALTDCTAGTIALMWPDNLPWKTQLELMEPSGEWLDLFGPGTGGEPGYEVECTLLNGLKLEDLCAGHSSALILEALEQWLGVGAFGVHGEFNFANPIASEEGDCTLTGAGVAALRGLGITWAIGIQLERLETDVSEV
jgi:hypothetical protein